MTPAGFHEFIQGLHAKPTKYKYDTHSHGSKLNMIISFESSTHQQVARQTMDGSIALAWYYLNTYLH
jgi:hypothetical protein